MAKLTKASDDPLRALYDLEHALRGLNERRATGVIDLTENSHGEQKRLEAKVTTPKA